MTQDTTYNGWTNYATWRVNLEICSDIDLRDWYDMKPETHEVADFLRNHVEEILSQEESGNLTASYALAFVADVNYWSIAEHLIENAYPS